jgi:hypothetical protein
MSSRSNRIPAGLQQVQLIADPGKRGAKMLDVHLDYEAGRTPEKKRTRPEAWTKTFQTLEGDTCSVSIEGDVIVLADSSGSGFSFTMEGASACGVRLGEAVVELQVRRRNAGVGKGR